MLLSPHGDKVSHCQLHLSQIFLITLNKDHGNNSCVKCNHVAAFPCSQPILNIALSKDSETSEEHGSTDKEESYLVFLLVVRSSCRNIQANSAATHSKLKRLGMCLMTD